jgi:tetratricopeptide (TPR) repeat protein
LLLDKKKSIGYAILCAIALVSFRVVADEPLEPILRLYDNAYDALLNDEVDLAEYHEMLDTILAELAIATDSADVMHLRGRVAYLRGVAEAGYGAPGEGAEHLESAIEIARAFRPDDAERSYILEAESRVELMQLKNFTYRVRYASGVRTLAQKALALNPDNIRARLLDASATINTPKLFGGNPAAGIEYIERTISEFANRISVTRPERFLSYLALGKAYIKTGNLERADQAYREAALLYPDSREIREYFEGR